MIRWGRVICNWQRGQTFKVMNKSLSNLINESFDPLKFIRSEPLQKEEEETKYYSIQFQFSNFRDHTRLIIQTPTNSITKKFHYRLPHHESKRRIAAKFERGKAEGLIKGERKKGIGRPLESLGTVGKFDSSFVWQKAIWTNGKLARTTRREVVRQQRSNFGRRR